MLHVMPINILTLIFVDFSFIGCMILSVFIKKELFTMRFIYSFAILLSALLVSPASASVTTNPCYFKANEGSVACRQYNYDVMTVYFRDQLSIEQKVIVKRVRSKDTKQLLHANYNFEVQCHNLLNCTDPEIASESVLWEFRNAIIENRLYIKAVQSCDPSKELCCDDYSCEQVYGADDENVSAFNSKGNVSSLLKKPRGSVVDTTILRTEAITNIYDNIARNTNNGSDFKEQSISKIFVDMPTFAYTEISSGNYTLCKLQRSGLCNRISGRMSIYDDSGYAELSHDEGQNVNLDLFDFLRQFYIEDRGMTCSQAMMNCGGGPINQCEIRMTCQVR